MSPRKFQRSTTGFNRARGYGTRLMCSAETQEASLHPKNTNPSLPTWDIRFHLPYHKLSPWYRGPFTVQGQLNEVTNRLNLPPQYHISPSFHVSLLKPYSEPLSFPTESGGNEVPPPPEMRRPSIRSGPSLTRSNGVPGWNTS